MGIAAGESRSRGELAVGLRAYRLTVTKSVTLRGGEKSKEFETYCRGYRISLSPHSQIITRKSPTQAQPLSPQHPLLHRPHPHITNRRKGKRQREADVAAIPRRADLPPNGTLEPELRHTHHGAHDAEAEGDNGGEAGREARRGVEGGDVVAAVREEEVLR